MKFKKDLHNFLLNNINKKLTLLEDKYIYKLIINEHIIFQLKVNEKCKIIHIYSDFGGWIIIPFKDELTYEMKLFDCCFL